MEVLLSLLFHSYLRGWWSVSHRGNASSSLCHTMWDLWRLVWHWTKSLVAISVALDQVTCGDQCGTGPSHLWRSVWHWTKSLVAISVALGQVTCGDQCDTGPSHLWRSVWHWAKSLVAISVTLGQVNCGDQCGTGPSHLWRSVWHWAKPSSDWICLPLSLLFNRPPLTDT